MRVRGLNSLTGSRILLHYTSDRSILYRRHLTSLRPLAWLQDRSHLLEDTGTISSGNVKLQLLLWTWLTAQGGRALATHNSTRSACSAHPCQPRPTPDGSLGEVDHTRGSSEWSFVSMLEKAHTRTVVGRLNVGGTVVKYHWLHADC